MIRVAILTISDRSYRGERPDASGPALTDYSLSQNWEVIASLIVPDEKVQIISVMREWISGNSIDIILTTGGTGFAPRDITPEATLEVIEKLAPGLAEAMRLSSLQKTPHAMLTRGICGIAGRTIIINLPGSPRAAVENLQAIANVLPHAIELLQESPTSETGHQFSNQ